MMKTGIIVGAFKPFTKGHDFLVTKASEECDLVKVFVSTCDRKRKNELIVSWNTMEKIWNKFIQKNLPSNIELIFDKNPAGKMMDYLYECNEDIKDFNKYYFYSDEHDSNIINNEKTKIKLNRLFSNNKIKFISYNRNKNINVSSTIARKHIQENNIEGLSETLPEYIEQEELEEIFELLRNK